MPRLSEVSQQDWKQMLATTKISTYEILEKIRHQPHHIAGRLRTSAYELVEAGWLTVDGNEVFSITEAGLKHLKSF